VIFCPWLGLKAMALASENLRPGQRPASYGFYQEIEGDFWLWPEELPGQATVLAWL
jgi:hypothetical protein